MTGEENSLQEVMYEGRVDNRNPFWSEEALFFSYKDLGVDDTVVIFSVSVYVYIEIIGQCESSNKGS